MSVRPILIYGEEVLHTVAAPVTDFGPNLSDLVEDMFDTMDAAPGVGLAAPQIGVGLRVFVYDYPHENGSPRRGVVVNPELFVSPSPVREVDENDDEGCLSFPGERYSLVRSERAIVRAVNLNNDPCELVCEGWFARIMQHEFDHLNGIIYVDRLDERRGRMAQRVARKKGWGVAGSSWLPGVDQIEA